MATTTKKRAPKAKEVEVEETEATTPAGMRPKDLAAKLEIDPKQLRNYLRKEFPRGSEDKNTSWYLSDKQVEKATAHFTKTDEESDDEE